MFNVLSTFTLNAFNKYYIDNCNFLALSYTRIFVFTLTLFCPLIRIWDSNDYSLKVTFVEEVAFFQVIFNLISTVPSLSTLGTRKTIPAETLDFCWLNKYVTEGNVMESGSFVNERSILPGA